MSTPNHSVASCNVVLAPNALQKLFIKSFQQSLNFKITAQRSLSTTGELNTNVNLSLKPLILLLVEFIAWCFHLCHVFSEPSLDPLQMPSP